MSEERIRRHYILNGSVQGVGFRYRAMHAATMLRTGRIPGILGRIILAGMLALGVLSGFCFFYYNIPAHREDPDGATDYRWEEKVFYSRATEGIAWGHTNNEGYANLIDYHPGDPVDVLIIGSSHMEAFQVAPEESTASRLNAMLPDETVYNIGISAHTFLHCADNLAAAVDKYQPSEYVVMDTAGIHFSREQLQRAVDGRTSDIDSHAGGILGQLQRIPYLRLLYSQVQNFREQREAARTAEKGDVIRTQATPEARNDEELLDALLGQLADTVQGQGAQLIILYHPEIQILEDGSMYIPEDPATEQFADLCAAHGIRYQDMREIFREAYEEDCTLPYGFCNSTVGNGHLNREGHEMIAQTLVQIMDPKEVE